MKDFIELLKRHGLADNLGDTLLFFFYITAGLFAIYKAVRAIIGWLNKRAIKKIMDKDLHPYFNYQEIAKYTKYYVPQYFQNISPTEGDEPGGVHAAAARAKLMPSFSKRA